MVTVYSQDILTSADKFARSLVEAVIEIEEAAVVVTGRRENEEEVAIRFEETPESILRQFEDIRQGR